MFERFRHHDPLLDRPLRANGRFARTKFEKWYDKHGPEARENKKQRTKRSLSRAALIATGLVLLGNADVQINKAEQSDAQARVSIRQEALDPLNNDQSIIMFGGYGSINATVDAKYIGPTIQNAIDGQIWSVNYNNAVLDSQQIVDEIVTTANEQDVDTITLVGRSAGGITAMEVAEILIKEHRALKVQALILISSPDGYEGVRPDKQELINLTDALDVAPDLAYSTPVRFLLELAMRSDRYDDGSLIERGVDFVDTATELANSLQKNYLPGGWLLVDQLLTIQDAQFEEHLQTIGADYKALRPVVIYLGTDTPGYDDTVDDDLSAQNIGGYSDAANIEFFNYDVPNAVHQRPDLATEEYAATMQAAAPDIQEAIEQNQSYYRIANQQIITRIP